MKNEKKESEKNSNDNLKKAEAKTIRKLQTVITKNKTTQDSYKKLLTNKFYFENKIDFEKLDHLEEMKILNEENHHVKQYLHFIRDKNNRFKLNNYNKKTKFYNSRFSEFEEDINEYFILKKRKHKIF